MTSLLDLPQDYVAELLQERGPRGRGLLHNPITHPYHVLLSRCKGTTIVSICKYQLKKTKPARLIAQGRTGIPWQSYEQFFNLKKILKNWTDEVKYFRFLDIRPTTIDAINT